MKISLISDLHLEFLVQYQSYNLPDEILNNTSHADVLLIAGDTCIFPKEKYQQFFRGLMEIFSKSYPKVFMVMGNHEHYHGCLTTTATKIRSFLSGLDNIHLLDNESITHEGVIFYGGTCWTSFNNYDSYIMNHAMSVMSDYRYIHYDENTSLTTSHIWNRYGEFVDGLLATLMDNPHTPVVVISHHTPSAKVFTEHSYRNETSTNFLYHNDFDEMITRHPQIKVWGCGHAHGCVRDWIGSTAVGMNSRGYPGEKAFNDFHEMIFDLDDQPPKPIQISKDKLVRLMFDAGLLDEYPTNPVIQVV